MKNTWKQKKEMFQMTFHSDLEIYLYSILYKYLYIITILVPLSSYIVKLLTCFYSHYKNRNILIKEFI